MSLGAEVGRAAHLPARVQDAQVQNSSRRRHGWFLGIATIAVIVGSLAISLRPVDRHGFDCGSVLRPRSVEVNGPVGTSTSPRPCDGAHEADFVATLVLFVSFIVLTSIMAFRWNGPERFVPTEEL